MNPEKELHPILFIDNYFPVIDGVTETVHEYAKRMNATVVCPEMESHYMEKHDFPYPLMTAKTIRAPFSRYASAVPALDGVLPKRIAQENPDIFHIHSPSLLGEYAANLGKKMKVPVVATFHSKYYDAILEFVKVPSVAKMLTQKIVRLYESCDAVWACSEETGETLRSYGYKGEYSVMPNGADTTFPANAAELKERAAAHWHLPAGKHILLFVGQQIWYKNQKLILDAFRLLCDEHDDYYLIMVGTGKDEKDIERYAGSLNLTGEQVLFTGQIRDRELLNGVYLNTDLLFFPSVFDNAPLVLREAAVLEVPALLAEGSNAAGAVTKNVNGFTAAATPEAMRDEIARIFAEEDVRKIGQAARETIPISWERLIPQVLAEYRRIIGFRV